MSNISNSNSNHNHQVIWTRRFIIAAIIQGAIVGGLTIFLVLGQLIIKPEISRVIAAGGAGTWFTFGYLVYLIVGVIGVAVSAAFYHYVEKDLGRKFNTKSKRIFAGGHLILMNLGAVASTGMLMYAGYIAGAAMLPVDVGGQGFNAGQAHGILAPFVEPISVFVIILIIGVILGGIGFLLAFRRA